VRQIEVRRLRQAAEGHEEQVVEAANRPGKQQMARRPDRSRLHR